MLVARRAAALRRELSGYALAVLFVVSGIFLVMMTVIASPFERLPQPALEGRGLNPLLEVTDMLVHPLLLYTGYVGFVVPFAFAMAALLAGRLDGAWLTLTRRWTVTAWLFLTSGILYGGWWSYRTLGWGGYWAWDPVENASFMPWLMGTAFVHSVMVQERRPDAEDLEHRADHPHVRAHDLRHLPHPERRDLVGPRLRQRRHRPVPSRLPGGDPADVARAPGLALGPARASARSSTRSSPASRCSW